MFGAHAAQVFETLAYCGTWVVMTVGMIWLYRMTEGGHKVDLLASALFFGIRALSNLFYAWDLLSGTFGTFVALHWVSGFTAVSYGFFVAVRVSHYITTLIRSEHVERIERNKIGDAETETEMLPYASRAVLRGVEEIRDGYDMRGALWQTHNQHLPQRLQ